MAKKKSGKSELSKEQKRIFLRWLWGLYFTAVVVTFCIFALISLGFIGYLPPIEELQNPKNKYASEIISSDGQLIGTFYTAQDNRINTQYNEISSNVIKALIATEDARFMKHSGIDGKALMRAIIFRGILHIKSAGGGSTITQQLAKQLFSPRAGNLIERAFQKPIEWVIAVKLEKLYTKEEIITMYLNKFDFLNNAVGITTAANVYFGCNADKLNIEQSATLVGMCKNPSLYNPARQSRQEATRERRNVVFKQMEKSNYITKEERDSLKQLPLVLNFHKVDHKLGMAPYFREYLRRMLTAKEPDRDDYASWQLKPYQQYYLDSIEWADNPLYGWIEKNPKSDGTKYDIYRDGLKIYVTIDSRMQKYAEEAVEQHMATLQDNFFKSCKGKEKAPFSPRTTDEQIEKFMNKAMRQSERWRVMKANGASEREIIKSFNTPTDMLVFSYNGQIDTTMTPLDSIRYSKYFARCGMMSIDPMTGHVKAYVGGTDFSSFQYDMVTAGRRQVGSTVKPYLYSLAMSNGYWPCQTTINQPYTLYDELGRPWTPRNDDKRRGETVSLRWGLQNSSNWISAYVMSLVTPQAMVDLMRSFGIKGELIPVVSICLGPCEVTVAEMVDAYTTFANRGIRTEPVYVTHIEDNIGNRIAEFTPKTEEVLSEETTYKMLDMLQAVVNGGTGSRVRYKFGFNAPCGGKTGTTQENSDGWFMGFTPQLVTGVWVGWEDRSVHFTNMAEGQGASMALPIWAIYMNKVYNDQTMDYSTEKGFNIPSWFNPTAGCQQ